VAFPHHRPATVSRSSGNRSSSPHDDGIGFVGGTGALYRSGGCTGTGAVQVPGGCTGPGVGRPDLL